MADIRMAHDALSVLCVLIPLTVGPHLRAWEIPQRFALDQCGKSHKYEIPVK